MDRRQAIAAVGAAALVPKVLFADGKPVKKTVYKAVAPHGLVRIEWDEQKIGEVYTSIDWRDNGEPWRLFIYELTAKNRDGSIVCKMLSP